MSDRERPLILTLALDGAAFAYLDALRRRHYPPERNQVPAHLTLFHALPGEEAARVRRELAGICRRHKPFALQATGLRFLGYGVAISFASPELVQLRQTLAREWRDWLTPQDTAKIAPHVTIQNKAGADVARVTLRELEGSFRPFTARAEGLNLWRYLGGPWRLDKAFRFGG
ncbi:2'-5' RNA ligase family protein [Enterovirga aerilata]|uniref:2'-5' RNA ligase family protein n=1 Tax=Enterovirga aerilata TaxID=2730920 RepID=A0A849IF77_9HYPH|nr:2'-5' RNA ligase family protein [Enterovirga sp. DB1703]NNM74617.1 2'-5' RNA ligase family protein [Enterovirga sp. DB1703]